MKEKHYSAIVKCHLVLMVILTILSIVNIVSMFTSTQDLKLNGVMINLMNVFAFACGILYLCKGYSKSASLLYKAFMLFVLLSNVFYVVRSVTLRGTHDLVVICIKIILLLVLALGRNMGKRTTWILFTILIAIDLVYWIPFGPRYFKLYVIMADTLIKLVIDGTIGLAIRGKYIDKEARGSK